MQFIKAIGLCFITLLMVSVSNAQQSFEDIYSKQVQPIFDNRCLACHSCFNAPCQLNLQNYEGFERGAQKLNVYATRVKSVDPSRMWIDAHGAGEWRKKGFFDVNTSKDASANLFYNFLKLRVDQPQKNITKQVAESEICPSSMSEFAPVAEKMPELGMPYGLPALNAQEMQTIESWIKKGAPGPSAASLKERQKIAPGTQKQIKEWEKFLNAKDLSQQLVSRYLYEHLFLAHIYFPEKKSEFFRLVRSKTACEKGVEEIASRRPNDDPGVKNFYYCLVKFPGTVVMKTHIPYEWSPKKLARYKKIFWETPWKAEVLPSYEPGVAENPFIAFAQIPVKARYQFLLDDSQYHVSTFIKGPVCNGSRAVNSIQEQFYAFFLDPNSDNMHLSKEYEKQAQELLMMPGVWGSDIELQETPIFLKKLVDHREKYRKLRTEWFKKMKPEGYTLADIWNGEGHNQNAVLTIFRHDDNAVVLKGAVGDLSKTVFVVDYPILERLVYNLVVNFDIFGNVGHQGLTRIYMDLIRMEAEELFLMFLPPEQRFGYRRNWYQGLLTQAKMTYVFPTVGVAEPTGVRFTEENHTKKQMIEKILFFRLNETVRGSLDLLNWRNISIPESIKVTTKLDSTEQELRQIASVPAVDANPFARYFPEVAYIKIKDQKGGLRVFTVIHNKEHENISWILGESLRLAPKEDTLTLKEGYWGSYPNIIFDVKEQDVPRFVTFVKSLKSEKDYQDLISAYGVRRTQASFWQHYDELNAHFRKTDILNFGFLDLTRYELN